MTIFPRLFQKSAPKSVQNQSNQTRLSLQTLEDRVTPATIPLIDPPLPPLNILVVTTSADVVDASDGVVSLREAIIEVNTNNPFPVPGLPIGKHRDVIQFDPSLAGKVITLNGTELEITDNVTISGLGATQLTISGNNQSRIFNISKADIIVSISDLKLTGGKDSNTDPLTGGGGAIFNRGHLILDDCLLINNSALGLGGAIHHRGDFLFLRNTTISGNTSEMGGGIYSSQWVDGSSILITSTVINRSTIANNSADFGGGIHSDGSLRLEFASILNNTATTQGGGIDITGRTDILFSTIAFNTASRGGGIAVDGPSTTGNGSGNILNGDPKPLLYLINSTISQNIAKIEGGGIWVGNNGDSVILNSTITLNRATQAGGGIYSVPPPPSPWDPFIFRIPPTKNYVFNSIIAGNFIGPAITGVRDVIPLIWADFILIGFRANDISGVDLRWSSQNNVIGDAKTSGGLMDGVRGNIVGINGQGTRPIGTILDPVLADNGGPTLTHLLVRGSVAINHGTNILDINPGTVPGITPDAPKQFTYDQRGPVEGNIFGLYPRIANGTIDIGAVEFPLPKEEPPPVTPPTPPVTPPVTPPTTPIPLRTFVTIGSSPGTIPSVLIHNGITGEFIKSIQPYSSAFTGGVHVALGDVNRDGMPDIITAVRSAGSPHIKVFDGKTGAEIRSFYAFDVSFTGGVFVASSDVNLDGFADIIVGAGASGSPHVKIFSGKNGALLKSFFAYAPNMTAGVRVTAGDVNGDSFADIITSPGAGVSPHVKVFDGKTGRVVNQFFAYDARYTGGVFVTLFDRDRDGIKDLFTGADSGANPHIKVFNALTGRVKENFYQDPSIILLGVEVQDSPPNPGQIQPAQFLEPLALRFLNNFEALPTLLDRAAI